MLVRGKNWKSRSTLDSYSLGEIRNKVERSIRSSIRTNKDTFITQPTTNRLVTLEMKHWIVNWDYAKTPMLQEISQNQHQVGGSVYIGNTFNGLVRNKQLYLIAALKLNLYRLMQDYGWRAFQQRVRGTQS